VDSVSREERLKLIERHDRGGDEVARDRGGFTTAGLTALAAPAKRPAWGVVHHPADRETP
jgi:hypothetical protein